MYAATASSSELSSLVLAKCSFAKEKFIETKNCLFKIPYSLSDLSSFSSAPKDPLTATSES